MTRYIVIGGGAVGASLAAQFDAAGIDYVLVARGESYHKLSSDGLRYIRPAGEKTLHLNVVAGPDDVALRPDDVLVLAVKAQQAERAITDWAWRPIGSETGTNGIAAHTLPILTFQNGIDTERIALRRFATVYGVSIWIPGTHVEPGTVIAAGTPAVGLVWVGRYPTGTDELASEIASDLTRAGFPTQVVPDVMRWKTTKLITNLLNAVDLFEATDDEVKQAQAVLEREAFAALDAAGLTRADPSTESTNDRTQLQIAPLPGQSSAHKSTWQSVARGSGSVETDYLNGEISLLGRLHGIPTPANDQLQAALGQLISGGDAPGSRRLADVLPALSNSFLQAPLPATGSFPQAPLPPTH
ncbi:ketopantoate reductase family protein [Rhodococcus sp. Eu-32]|uniref:ketopantoate reductase family protein n=1 Tax=Rhodococcus sp. Eu-32 TaxID=1017319 RepID=UPI000DF40D0C|nr:2-dehydropantoate 2-reductase N-terminal domain-containing protein [Rhodococcus sp. Eu-32]RRQ29419.1 ketopantoate reductase family protein [Rhodococcus sp. Eu-32]